MWLPVDIALWCAVVLGLVGVVLRPHGPRWRTTTVPVVRELALMLLLYAAWRSLADITVLPVDGAMDRGRRIWDLERAVHLPSELTLQQITLHWATAVRVADAYYIVAHVAPLGILLVWLFFRHRDAYPMWRNVLVLVSLAGLLVQLVPVAPPRMYPALGFVDTGAVYGPRVYDAMGLVPGQVAAMPSMHVAWAVLIGAAVVTVSTSRWRWVVLAHPVLTMWAVTVTAYHWLLDGIVAAALLALCVVLAQALERARVRPGAEARDAAAAPQGVRDEVS